MYYLGTVYVLRTVGPDNSGLCRQVVWFDRFHCVGLFHVKYIPLVLRPIAYLCHFSFINTYVLFCLLGAFVVVSGYWLPRLNRTSYPILPYPILSYLILSYLILIWISEYSRMTSTHCSVPTSCNSMENDLDSKYFWRSAPILPSLGDTYFLSKVNSTYIIKLLSHPGVQVFQILILIIWHSVCSVHLQGLQWCLLGEYLEGDSLFSPFLLSRANHPP